MLITLNLRDRENKGTVQPLGLCGQVEVGSNDRVILNFFDNRIEYILADMQMRFQKRNEFLAIIRVDPRAVLKSEESYLAHGEP